MTPLELHARLGDLPYMTVTQGRIITDLIQREGAKRVLEVGFYHGVSTAYIANAVGEDGLVETIDLTNALNKKPHIYDVLNMTGLSGRVKAYLEECGSWRLMKMIEEDHPKFDFVYLDGGHTWASTGFAFFLADKLLKVGGIILFDDYDWSYAMSPTMKDDPYVMAMSPEFRDTKQVKKVVDLLVAQHESYGDLNIDGNWAYARKIK